MNLRNISFVILISICTIFAQTGYFANDANTVGLWRLNEAGGTTTADASGNGHTGTIAGGPGFMPAVYGNGLNFTGSGQVTIPRDDRFTPAANITVEALIKMTSYDAYGCIVANLSWDGPEQGYELCMVNGQLRFVFGGAGASHWIGATSPVQAPLNTWLHVAGTFDGRKIRVFVLMLIRD